MSSVLTARWRALVVGVVLGAVLGSSLPMKAVGHGVRHRFVSAIPDGTDPRQIQPSAWNDEHVFETLPFGAMLPPSAPIHGDCWMEASGTTTVTLAWKCSYNGVTRTVASTTF